MTRGFHSFALMTLCGPLCPYPGSAAHSWLCSGQTPAGGHKDFVPCSSIMKGLQVLQCHPDRGWRLPIAHRQHRASGAHWLHSDISTQKNPFGEKCCFNSHAELTVDVSMGMEGTENRCIYIYFYREKYSYLVNMYL